LNKELLLLLILLNKVSYNQYINDIDTTYLKEHHREISYLYKVLQDLHKQYDHDLTLADLQAAFFVAYPDADNLIYNALFKTLYESNITADVGQGIIRQIKAKKAALKLSEKAFKVAQGLEDVDSLTSFYNDEFVKVDHQEEQEFELDNVSQDLTEIIDDVYKESGLRWRLDCLNKSLGSLRKGDFGFIMARPETGKTTFLTSEVTHMLMNSTGPVIHLNNEEQGNKVMLRYYQAFFGVTMQQLMASPKKYRDAFQEATQGRFYLFDSAIITKWQVEKIVKRLNPILVIYDQLTKIRGFKADRPDLILGETFQWARELAKGSHAAIGVSQADGSAENVRYLTMEHVANAKTAVQAEADWILGIGKSHDMEKARFLSISKNKLLGDADSIPDLRHGKFEVLIEAPIARYLDVIKFA